MSSVSPYGLHVCLEFPCGVVITSCLRVSFNSVYILQQFDIHPFTPSALACAARLATMPGSGLTSLPGVKVTRKGDCSEAPRSRPASRRGTIRGASRSRSPQTRAAKTMPSKPCAFPCGLTSSSPDELDKSKTLRCLLLRPPGDDFRALL